MSLIGYVGTQDQLPNGEERQNWNALLYSFSACKVTAKQHLKNTAKVTSLLSVGFQRLKGDPPTEMI